MRSSRSSTTPSCAEVEAELPTSLIQERRAAASDLVRHTPLFSSRSLSDQCGGQVALKAENLQRTGSFKIRGALAKLDRISPRSASGVVVGSAGNHGQSVAYAARARGIRCRVYIPDGAAVAKVGAVEAFGGEVILGGDSVDACLERARNYAADCGATLVHPFDDLDVLRGQGSVGLELLEDAPDISQVLIPIGGGGLAGTTAMVLKRVKPTINVIGVQAEGCAPLVDGVTDRALSGASLADGIAIKRPGRLTLPLIERYVDELHVVSEESIAEAMVLLLERAKLLVEGAGAAALAPLLSGEVTPASTGTTVVLLSGGNVDVSIVSAVTRRNETESGRRLRLLTRVADRPGGLAAFLSKIAAAHANVLTIQHVRDALPLHVRETGVEVILETRGTEHSQTIIELLEQAGYEIVQDPWPRCPPKALGGARRSRVKR